MSKPNISHCDCIGTESEDSFCKASYLQDLNSSDKTEPSDFEKRMVDL